MSPWHYYYHNHDTDLSTNRHSIGGYHYNYACHPHILRGCFPITVHFQQQIQQHLRQRPCHPTTTTGTTRQRTRYHIKTRSDTSQSSLGSLPHSNRCATMQHLRQRPGHTTITTGITQQRTRYLTTTRSDSSQSSQSSPQHNNGCATMQHLRQYPGHPTTTTGITQQQTRYHTTTRSDSPQPSQGSPQ